MQTDRTIPDSTWAGFTASGEPRMLRRALTSEERRLLEWRAASLRPHLSGYARPGEDDIVTEALAKMFGSFTSMREEGAAAIAKINTTKGVLEEFPAWGIVETCASIQIRGYTTLKDGIAITERRWPPSDPDLHHAVEVHVRTRADALRYAERLLEAKVEPTVEETPEQKAAAVARWEAEKSRMVGPAELAALHTGAEERWRAEAAERARSIVARTYERAGVEMPEGATTTLPMMLTMGWTIEEHDGRRQLVSPTLDRAR